MVRKYKGKKTSVKTAEALARESLKQEEKAENVSAASAEQTALSLCFQCSGLQISPEDVENAVKKDMKQKGYTAKNVQIYVNMEEAAAYYVLDGTAGGDYCVILR